MYDQRLLIEPFAKRFFGVAFTAPAPNAFLWSRPNGLGPWAGGRPVCTIRGRRIQGKRLWRRPRTSSQCSQRSVTSKRHEGVTNVSLVEGLPRVYPVTTERSSGFGFLVSPGFIVTCEHVVARKGSICVAGADATMVASCAADIALLYVPALKKENAAQFRFKDGGIAFSENMDEGKSVVVCNPSRTAVPASVREPFMMLYRSSGAQLPSLRIELSDSKSAEMNDVGHGWSGAPVVCSESRGIIGMIAYGGREPATSNSVFAVPGPVMHWFLSCCDGILIANDNPLWVPMGALAHVLVQTLSGKAGRLATELYLSNAAVLPTGLGVRVARAPRRSGLLVGDIVLMVNGMKVDSDGCVVWKTMRVGYEAALMSAKPGSKIIVKVLRRCSDGTFRMQEVSASVDPAESSALGVAMQGRKRVLEAGAGAVRLVELTIELLEGWYGESWQTACGLDILRTALGESEHSDEGDGPERAHVVVDPSFFARNSNSGHGNRMGREDLGWNELKGKRVCRVNAQEVRCLDDIVAISREQPDGKPLVAELFPNFIALLPRPLTIFDVPDDI
jgi:hypothetical protein